MEFKDYEQLGKLLKKTEKIMSKYRFERPKKLPINKHFLKAHKYVNETKNHLEEMMYIEHRELFSTNIFYGSLEDEDSN